MKQAIIAAVYVALTVGLEPISYLGIQCRISEFLVILILFNKKHAFGLTIGCFIANLFSPIPLDLVVGTAATAISLLLMINITNDRIALLVPPLVNGLMVGWELMYAFDLPFLLSAAQVFIGEFIIVTLVGGLALKPIRANTALVRMLSE